jgi:hypothetical protein
LRRGRRSLIFAGFPDLTLNFVFPCQLFFEFFVIPLLVMGNTIYFHLFSQFAY